MAIELLIHGTGVFALLLNIVALCRRCEKKLRIQSGIAGVAWALNNLLLGANTAAALSLVSAGRTATSAAMLRCDARLRLASFAGFSLLTLGIGLSTWDGWPSGLITAASLLSTYAMFYMDGRALRWILLTVSGLWMYHAFSHHSWEQIVANGATAGAALYGAWRIDRTARATVDPDPASASA
jgi:hypothetical protein